MRKFQKTTTCLPSNNLFCRIGARINIASIYQSYHKIYKISHNHDISSFGDNILGEIDNMVLQYWLQKRQWKSATLKPHIL